MSLNSKKKFNQKRHGQWTIITYRPTKKSRSKSTKPLLSKKSKRTLTFYLINGQPFIVKQNKRDTQRFKDQKRASSYDSFGIQSHQMEP